MKRRTETYDVVVCGGGLAGFCAAVAAARLGRKTCLVQDRPVLGGNSSSEIRVTPNGAAIYHAYSRETGIISELLIEERVRNHEPLIENGGTNSVWDMVLYDVAVSTPNLTLHLNTTITGVIPDLPGEPDQVVTETDEPNKDHGYWHRPACNRSRRIKAVVGRVAAAELELTIHGRAFIDCTGDGVVADLAGCEWRMGTESRSEFDEPHAPAQASTDTMGSSIHIKAKDVGRPVGYTAPAWAVKHDNPDYFWKQGRHIREIRGGYWWLEIGVPWHTIHDNETIRHELTRHTLGVWEWIKNRDPKVREKAATMALDWVGQVPGKRESRRIIGQYFMTEHDVVNRVVFDDEVAFGGWSIDLHTPGGLLAGSSEPQAAENHSSTTDYAVSSYAGPYGIPLRVCLSRDVDNLLMAGRNISVTHVALGTVRVMATCALMGQAVGTAAAVAVEEGIEPAQVPQRAIRRVQQLLLRDGCFLLSAHNADEQDLARQATASTSSEATVGGARPDGSWVHDGLHSPGADLEDLALDRLDRRRGQWIAIASDRIEKVRVFLSNNSDVEQQVEARLMPVDHLWDYRVDSGAPLASTTLRVPPGRLQWVEWPVNCVVTPGRYVRLDLLPNEQVQWHTAGELVPGHASAFEMGKGRMRRYRTGVTLAFGVAPRQASFGPANVLSGVTRPYQHTNLWRSDPAQPLPQWLELKWERPQSIRRVILTFPGHLLRASHAYDTHYRDAQAARDYRVEAWVEGQWRPVLRVEGNYQRRREHVLESAVETDRLRIVIEATNGDPSAAVYEVRCYGH